METNQTTQQKLDIITELLRNLVALEFSKRGASRELIAKHLHIAKATVVEMLRGIKED